MPSMDYDEAAAERLEAVYLGPDVRAQRQDTLARLDVKAGETVLDIGSGPGFLAAEIAERTGPKGRVEGIDISDALVHRATRRNPHPWLSFGIGDATNLPFEDASFDVVVSTQVAEYVADIDAFCAETHRVLRPGGRGLILATDWDSISWYSAEPERMQMILDAFAPHCANSRLPRTLAGRLRRAGLSVVGVSCFPIVNLAWYDGCYSQTCIPFIAAYVKGQRTVPLEVVDAWAAELADLAAAGDHFFATSRFSFQFLRPSG